MLVVRQKHHMAYNGVFRLENGVGIVDEQNLDEPSAEIICRARPSNSRMGFNKDSNLQAHSAACLAHRRQEGFDGNQTSAAH